MKIASRMAGSVFLENISGPEQTCTMGCCRVNSYCGCWTLETGARAIAIGETVLYFLEVVVSIAKMDIARIVGGALGILISLLLLYGVR